MTKAFAQFTHHAADILVKVAAAGLWGEWSFAPVAALGTISGSRRFSEVVCCEAFKKSTPTRCPAQ